MARRTRLYNTRTGKWEYVTFHCMRMPWERMGARLRVALRSAVRFYRVTLFPSDPPERMYEFDPVTLNMRDPKRERRMRRRDRRDRLLAKAADALNSMVEMQKHIG